MGGNTDGGGDECEVFDDVLPCKGRHPRRLPAFAWQVHERHKGGRHMKEEERQDDTLGAFDEEEDADEHLEQREEQVEGVERHPVNSLVKERMHERAGGRKTERL